MSGWSGGRAGARRLRREEVAQLAGMSTDYYVRLEQQRAPQPSVQITAALARALRLSLDERDHLFVLIGHNAPARFHRSEHVNPPLMRVLDRLDDTPALVQTDLLDTLAMNPLAVALLGDQTRHTGLASSGYYRWFMDPAERLMVPEEARELHGRAQAARLRAALTAGSDTPEPPGSSPNSRSTAPSSSACGNFKRSLNASRTARRSSIPNSAASMSTLRSCSPRTALRLWWC